VLIDKRILEMEELLKMIGGLRSDCDHPVTQWITSYGMHVKGADLEFLKNNRDSLIAMAGHAVKFDEAADIGVWMYYGDIKIGGQSTESNDNKPIAERNQEVSNELFKVSYAVLNPENRSKTVTLRGRTKEDAIIPIRAETNGILEQRLVNRGDFVNLLQTHACAKSNLI